MDKKKERTLEGQKGEQCQLFQVMGILHAADGCPSRTKKTAFPLCPPLDCISKLRDTTIVLFLVLGMVALRYPLFIDYCETGIVLRAEEMAMN